MYGYQSYYDFESDYPINTVPPLGGGLALTGDDGSTAITGDDGSTALTTDS